jgi:hypothetical protein
VAKAVAGPCGSCRKKPAKLHCLVRLYVKTRQWQYHYRLCDDCFAVLDALLETSCDGVQKGIFDHNAGLTPEQQSRAYWSAPH